jgi:hypothetical protein
MSALEKNLGPESVEKALRHYANQLRVEAEKFQLFRNLVASRTDVPRNRVQEYSHHEQVLLGNEAQILLLIIWKESSFVSCADRSQVGVQRRFSRSRPMTAYGLAVALYPTEAGRVAAAYERLKQHILPAAAAFGLISVIDGKRKRIAGTELLADYMIQKSIIERTRPGC